MTQRGAVRLAGLHGGLRDRERERRLAAGGRADEHDVAGRERRGQDGEEPAGQPQAGRLGGDPDRVRGDRPGLGRGGGGRGRRRLRRGRRGLRLGRLRARATVGSAVVCQSSTGGGGSPAPRPAEAGVAPPRRARRPAAPPPGRRPGRGCGSAPRPPASSPRRGAASAAAPARPPAARPRAPRPARPRSTDPRPGRRPRTRTPRRARPPAPRAPAPRRRRLRLGRRGRRGFRGRLRLAVADRPLEPAGVQLPREVLQRRVDRQRQVVAHLPAVVVSDRSGWISSRSIRNVV